MHTWKCHKETPCIAILNKNVIFFFYKIREQESGKMEQVLSEGVVAVGEQRMWGKGIGG
jgi:hypothetical protein